MASTSFKWYPNRWAWFLVLLILAFTQLLVDPTSLVCALLLALIFVVLDGIRTNSEHRWLAIGFLACGIAWSLSAILVSQILELDKYFVSNESDVDSGLIGTTLGFARFLGTNSIGEALNALNLHIFLIVGASLFSSIVGVACSYSQVPGWKSLLLNAPTWVFVTFLFLNL